MLRKNVISITNKREGSILVLAVMTLLILSSVLAATFLITSNKFATMFQTASWQEALFGAESGADLAMTALNTKVWTGNGTWAGWKTGTGTPPKVAPTTYATDAQATSAPTTGFYNYTIYTINHSGQGNTRMTMYVTVDAPSSLNNNGYRIRSMGTTSLPGPAISAEQTTLDSFDTTLRKLSLLTNRFTGGSLTNGPEVSRIVELVVMYGNGSNIGILSRSTVILSGGGYVDSFDSSNNTKSTNSLYVLSKRQSNATVATNSSTSSSNLNNTYVYGNLEYSGPTIPNTKNVQGSIVTNYTTSIASMLAPGNGWTANMPILLLMGNGSFTGGTKAFPTRYQLSTMNVPASSSLTINPDSVDALLGQTSYVEIYVTGDMNLTGTVIQSAGVQVTYYVGGNITLGDSYYNLNNKASTVLINGITPTNGTPNTVNVSGQGGNILGLLGTGTGQFIGTINAPDDNVTISGAMDFSGSVTGKTVTLSKGANLHFDEALKGSGGGATPTVVSWYEDTK